MRLQSIKTKNWAASSAPSTPPLIVGGGKQLNDKNGVAGPPCNFTAAAADMQKRQRDGETCMIALEVRGRRRPGCCRPGGQFPPDFSLSLVICQKLLKVCWLTAAAAAFKKRPAEAHPVSPNDVRPVQTVDGCQPVAAAAPGAHRAWWRCPTFQRRRHTLRALQNLATVALFNLTISLTSFLTTGKHHRPYSKLRSPSWPLAARSMPSRKTEFLN